MFERLKEIREYEGLTQKEIAQKLHVTRATYAGWESGKDIIPLQKLNDFANLFHLSLDFLVGNTTSSKNISMKQDIDPQIVAEHLKNFRINNKLSQQKMAELIKTSQANIHKYETGKALITTIYALEFSKNFNYSLDELIGRK